jgi:hypothetical protein
MVNYFIEGDCVRCIDITAVDDSGLITNHVFIVIAVNSEMVGIYGIQDENVSANFYHERFRYAFKDQSCTLTGMLIW